MEPIEKLLNPKRITSLKGIIPSEGVRVFIVRDILRPPERPMMIKNIFPFSTIEDLKYEIWLQQDSDSEFLPRYTSLLYTTDFSEEAPQEDQVYFGADYLYFDTTSATEPLDLLSPLKQQTDERFVDPDGQLQPLRLNKRDRFTLEDLFRSGIPTFHLYTAAALKASIGTGQISEYDFNGRIAPYFPSLSSEQDISPTESELAQARKLSQGITLRRRQIENAERIIEEDTPGLLTPNLSGITRLRLLWPDGPGSLRGSDELFYKLDASQQRPFLRLLPVDGTALTKLYSPPGGLTIPEYIPVELIKQWALEKAPVNDSDYLILKILLHLGGGFPLFGSMRVMQDASADLIIMPPKNVRKLTPQVEFANFETNLLKGLESTGYEALPFRVDETSLVSFFKIEGPKLSGAKLAAKAKQLGAFFQQITPLPNEQPLISLRYKKVSNFASEDKIFSFLTQVISKKLVEGTETLAGLPRLLADEFAITEEEANNRIIAWNKSREQFAIGEKKDIKAAVNPGTDIYIFAQHPFYFCHIYRAASAEDLDRIYILLSMILNVADEEFNVPGPKEVEEVETTVSPEGDVVRTMAPKPGSPELTLPTAVEEEQGEDFEGYDYGMYELPNEDEPPVGENPYEEGQVEPETTATLPAATAPSEVAATAAAKPTTTQAQQQPQPKQQEPQRDDTKIVADSFYIKRLKDLDKDLFVFKKAKGDKSVSNYSVGCAANEDRQPLIMDELQYKRMRDIYDEDEDLVFIEYPLREKKNPEIPKGKEIAYVLKYGSDPAHQNYFVCAEYFCIRDDIWLRKKEFENGTVDRDGKPKKKGECPFCHGTLIKDKDSPGIGETVLRRKNKPKKDIPHLFVRFLTKKKNPDGLSLPCCFVDSGVIRIEDPDFTHVREYESQLKKTEEPDDEAAATTTSLAPTTMQGEVPNYDVLKFQLSQQYIVSSEKYPLEAGKVGLCPASLDKYLGQVSQTFVSRDAIRQELKKNAYGFLRVGVQNGIMQRKQSLFAALAPLLGVDTAEEVGSLIKQRLNVLQFMSLNFGNLVLEFFKPTDPDPTDNDLAAWVRDNIPNIIGKIGPDKKDYLVRIYNAWQNFLRFLDSPSQIKELRQFAHMIAEPGILTEHGITIIVLEYSGTPGLQDTTINVRCPLHGFSSTNYSFNDIAFLTHDDKGIWEPLIYTTNTPAVGGQVAKHEAYYTLQASMMNTYPDEIRKRIQEFREKCNSSGLAAFTSQTGVDGRRLIPKFTLLYANKLALIPYGLVYDSYNHLVAATFRTKNATVVTVPLADDGTLANFDDKKSGLEIKRIYFGWENIQAPAETDDVIEFYRNQILKIFAAYKGYQIESIVVFEKGRFIAVKLQNGVLIPASKVSENSKYPDIKVEQSDTLPEWYINNKLVFSKKTQEEEKLDLDEVFIPETKKQIEEVYQHLRLTFANYIAGSKAGSRLRKKIRDIIEARRLDIGVNVPYEIFERRKRLEILLEPLLRSWLVALDPFSPRETLLRMDCTRITEKTRCDNFCMWREDDSKCLIHIPSEVDVGGGQHIVKDSARYFIMKLLDELLRLPEKRRQLMNKEVGYLSSPKAITRLGDQLVIPETNPQWYQMLIDETQPKKPERPRFFEEFSRVSAAAAEAAQPLPEALVEALGREVAPNFQLWASDSLINLMTPLNVRLIDFVSDEEVGDIRVFTKPILDKIAMKLTKIVLQINLTDGGSIIAARTDKTTNDVIVFVITESGEPAFLVDVRFPTRPYVLRSELGKLEEKIAAIPQRLRIVRPKVARTAAAPTQAPPQPQPQPQP